jgi:AraC-like DNA-binding protein
MSIIRHRPSFALAAWVNCFWYSTGEPSPQDGRIQSDRSAPRRSALPTGGMDVVFNLHQDSFEVLVPDDLHSVRTEGVILHGAQSSHFIIAARSRGPTAGIHFRPGGGAVLLGLPASELTDQHLALSDLWGARASQLRTQLLECKGPAQIFDAMEQALVPHLRALQAPLVHPAISFALRSFAAQPGISRVTPIQEATGYSARRFNTLFQQAVGLAPKRFCQIQRLRAVVEQVARGEPIEWAKVAADNGYFDQSHLNRDFRLFSGVTPGQYRPISHDSALHMEL